MEVTRFRDARLDFLRGLAICMILVDHVASNPLTKVTYQAIGFSDAAEIFVLVSGIACGIAYPRALARGGRWGLAGSILKRVTRIYAYYVLTTVAVVSIAFLAMKYLNVELEFYDFEPGDTLGTFLRAFAMIQPTPYAGILVLYIILTVAIVPAFVLARGSLKIALLVMSALIWGASQIVDTAHLTPNLFFNPFAWQFLFSIGVVFGLDRELDSPILGYLQGLRWVLLLAWSIVLIALSVRILSLRSIFDIGALRLDPSVAAGMKQNLSPLRLIHFLSVAYLVSFYFSAQSKILKFRLASPLIMMGTNSLQVFCFSLVLTHALNVLILVRTPSLAEWLALDVVAFAALAIVAAAASLHRAHRRHLMRLRAK